MRPKPLDWETVADRIRVAVEAVLDGTGWECERDACGWSPRDKAATYTVNIIRTPHRARRAVCERDDDAQ